MITAYGLGCRETAAEIKPIEPVWVIAAPISTLICERFSLSIVKLGLQFDTFGSFPVLRDQPFHRAAGHALAVGTLRVVHR
jgi:hypothetical protein